MAKAAEITTLLFNRFDDLNSIQTECRPGFERVFWRERVRPILFHLNMFLHHGAATAFRCRTEVEGLMIQIRKFRSVYGGIKTIYKTLEETRDLLRGYELAKNPISTASLFDLSARVVRRNPSLESILYKYNPNFPREFSYSYKDYFKLFMILHMKEYTLGGKKGYEVNFCTKVADTIIKIDMESTLNGKVRLARDFTRRCEAMKTPSFRKDLAIKKFKEFVRTYEVYL